MAKKLLEESTVRRFMKIAGLQPLSESFVQELEEEVVEEMYKEEEPGMEAGDMEEPDMPEPEEMPSPEAPEAPEEAGEEEVELDAEMGEDDKVELLQKLAKALGVEVEVEADEEAGEEAGEEEMPEEPGAPEAEEEMMEEGEHMEETPVDPAGDNLEQMDSMEAAKNAQKDADMSAMPKGKQEHMAESKEAFKKRLVEEVARRVAARLKDLK